MDLFLPGSGRADVAASAPGAGPGNWAGASSAVATGEGFVVAYRVRTARDRGARVVVARSADGVELTPVAELPKDRFGAESLERPALVRTDDGRWRLYLSCATPGTKHWRIDLLEASVPDEFVRVDAVTVLPGDERTGVKDPLLSRTADGWQAWVCCHPLDVAGAEDRMVSRLAVSADGVAWRWTGIALEGRRGAWDARGARVTAAVGDRVAYDGRAAAAENFAERTGLAIRDGDTVTALNDGPVSDARYLDVVALPDGGYRIWYEAPLPDGSHELRTEAIPAGVVSGVPRTSA